MTKDPTPAEDVAEPSGALRQTPERKSSELTNLQAALARSEEKLRELESQNAIARARYETVFQHAGIGIALSKLDGHLFETNGAFQKMLGYKAGELEGKHFATLTHPEDRDRDVTQVKELAQGQRERLAFEKRYLKKGGEQLFARVVVSLVRNDQGAPAYLIAMVHDVTDLVETRSRAEILYASASVGIWDWIDVNGDKEYWTPRFYELLGYENGEIPATLENFRNALHPDDHAHTFASVQAHFEGKGDFDVQYRLRRKSGEYRWFRGLGHAAFDAQGQPTRMVGTIHDIHYQRTAREQIDRLAVRYDLSLRASNIGVWDWDIPANDLVWDERMYGLYGIGAEDWGSAYEAWLAGVHPDDRQEGDRRVQQALSGEQEFDAEFRVVWPSGEVRTLHAIAAVVRNHVGEPIRMVGVNWDVTEERARIQELERVNKELEDFAYFASHDLQAPIRHVASFVSLLEKKYGDQFDEKGRKWLGYVTEGTAHMKSLVKDLLAYSRVGRGENTIKPVALDRLVEGVFQRLHASEDGAKLETSYDTLPVVAGNPVQLEQVFQNLLSNAVRYAKPGVMPQVILRWDETTTHWRISVQDNGIGIAPEHHKRIFEPFQRLTPTDSSGSGIGLAICTKVVERHGGAIDVASAPGKGSTFTFTLRKVSPPQRDRHSAPPTG